MIPACKYHVIAELVHQMQQVTLATRKIKETLRSTLNTKLDRFKNLVNLSGKIFLRSEFKLLGKKLFNLFAHAFNNTTNKL